MHLIHTHRYIYIYIYIYIHIYIFMYVCIYTSDAIVFKPANAFSIEMLSIHHQMHLAGHLTRTENVYATQVDVL